MIVFHPSSQQMDNVQGDLWRLCRVCAKECVPMINLFNSKTNDLFLNEMLAKCIQKQIDRNDAKPSKICLRCVDQLCSAYEFCCLANASQVKFQHLIATALIPAKTIKAEKMDSDDIEMTEISNIGHMNTDETFPLDSEPLIDVGRSPLQLDPLAVEPAKSTDQNVQLAKSVNATELSAYANYADPLQLSGVNQSMLPASEPVENKLKEAEPVGIVNAISPYECYLCKIKFKTYDGCRVHLDGHMEVSCKICSVYLSADGYKKHLCQGLNMKCEYCDESFPSTIKILGHLNCHKGQYKMHKCNTCSKILLSQFLLEAHKRQHRDLDTSTEVSCEICRVYFSVKGLKKHFCQGLNTKCEYCNETFQSTINLIEHSKCHTDQLHKCTECSKMFGSAFLLNAHKHNDSKKSYGCDICDRHFKNKHALKGHQLAHSAVKRKFVSTCFEISMQCPLGGR